MSFTSDRLQRCVLIETYWNVNTINSSITQSFLVVLIETYWNVNLNTAVGQVDTLSVLIETYWNVNTLATYPFSVL